MLPFTLSSLLARRRAKSGRNPRAQEPADMGTAFGLDLSLNLLHPETPVVPAARPPSWMSRLALRRKQAL